VALKATGSRPPVFCLPQASGSTYTYLALARQVDAQWPVLAFQAPGLDDDDAPLETIGDLATRYLTAMLDRQPAGPYHLVGYSAGALIAFEIARHLAEAGQAIALLALIDPPVPAPAPPPAPAELVQLFADQLAATVGVPEITLGPIAEAASDGDWDTEVLAPMLAVLQRDGLVPAGLGLPFLRRRLAVFSATARAMAAYEPASRFSGRMTLIRAAGSPDSRPFWREWAASLDDVVIPGDHFTIWHQPNVATLTSVLRQRLDRVTGLSGMGEARGGPGLPGADRRAPSAPGAKT
jgi:thioesterase domain-containing protein